MNYSKLRAYLFDQYKLTLTQDTSLDELCRVVDETRMEGQGVQFILVNALRHLDNEGLIALRDEIGERIGPKLCRWMVDEQHGFCETSCGHITPYTRNLARICAFCGKEIATELEKPKP